MAGMGRHCAGVPAGDGIAAAGGTAGKPERERLHLDRYISVPEP